MIIQINVFKIMNRSEILLEIYNTLQNKFGNQNWWPSKTPFETILGTILTQNVSWMNASKAVKNLDERGLLDEKKLWTTPVEEIAPLIKSSRYYNQKSKKIKDFMDFFYLYYNNDLEKMKEKDTSSLRTQLLQIRGFGKETVDSILLYACEKPIFVIDTYTIRIFHRFGIFNEDITYDDAQAFFKRELPLDVNLYNDFHAQIVNLGNLFCKKTPFCEQCPICKIGQDLQCEYARNYINKS